DRLCTELGNELTIDLEIARRPIRTAHPKLQRPPVLVTVAVVVHVVSVGFRSVGSPKQRRRHKDDTPLWLGEAGHDVIANDVATLPFLFVPRQAPHVITRSRHDEASGSVTMSTIACMARIFSARDPRLSIGVSANKPASTTASAVHTPSLTSSC